MEPSVESDRSRFKFEGLLGAPLTQINNLNQQAPSFLPYNPTIVEVGAYDGTGTVSLAHAYRYGRIFAFEPNPRAFDVLAQRLEGQAHVTAVPVAIGPSNGTATLHIPAGTDDVSASLLQHGGRAANGSSDTRPVRVPVVVLDDWCGQQGLTRVHFLRLDAGGIEMRILQSSPRILSTALVVVSKTYLGRSNAAVISFPLLKQYLEREGFELLSHWYEEGAQGEATFVRRILYDSIFR